MLKVIELSESQSKESNNIEQLHHIYTDAVNNRNKYRGSMSWKSIHGSDYLYIKKGSGEWKSLGVRSSETELKYSLFIQGKESSSERLASLKKKLTVQAKFAKAVGINRVPLIISKVISSIQKAGISDAVSVIGTNALYVYEAMAGVVIDQDLMATEDIDFLWDNRKKIAFASKDGVNGFLPTLQRADKTFSQTGQSFRAANNDGYIVDLIIPEPKNRMQTVNNQMGSKNDLKAVEIGSLRWLINSPKVKATVIDSQGFPLEMTAPDPRCFAIHKLWLSKQPDRNPKKTLRDQQQSMMIANVIQTNLPMFPFNREQLKMFPEALVTDADNNFEMQLTDYPSMS